MKRMVTYQLQNPYTLYAHIICVICVKTNAKKKKNNGKTNTL